MSEATGEDWIQERVAEIMANPEVRARVERLVGEMESRGAVIAGDDAQDPVAAATARGRLLGLQIMRELGYDIDPDPE